MQKLINHLEFRIFLRMMQARYSQALADDNAQEMMSAAGSLSLVYSSLGNTALARRWADEFWHRWAIVNRRQT